MHLPLQTLTCIDRIAAKFEYQSVGSHHRRECQMLRQTPDIIGELTLGAHHIAGDPVAPGRHTLLHPTVKLIIIVKIAGIPGICTVETGIIHPMSLHHTLSQMQAHAVGQRAPGSSLPICIGKNHVGHQTLHLAVGKHSVRPTVASCKQEKT